ncbi:12271_t:CDS:1, partial [Gigaspora rosea]
NLVPFKLMQKLLGEALSDNLELLPNNPDSIPEHVIEFLPFALPFTE